MSLQNTMLELDVEEQIFYSLVTRTPDECDALLGSIKDVDVRNMSQRTLLHVAVRVGRAEWVERLLEMGADPLLRDRGGLTVLQAAEEMCSRHPDDSTRKHIHRLVQLVDRRESGARERQLQSGGGDDDGLEPGGGAQESSPHRAPPEMEPGRDLVTEQLEQVTSKISVLSEYVVKLSSEAFCMKVNNVSLLKDSSLILECVTDVKAVVGRVEAELRTLRRALEEHSGETLALTTVSLNSEDRTRLECLDAMMHKTVILNSDAEKVAKVRGFYERLYFASPLTSCVLSYLQFQSRVKVHIDCDSMQIQQLKERYIGHDGTERLGSGIRTFADFDDCTVYASGCTNGENGKKYTIAFLGKSLAMMSIYLAFGNKGRPYFEGAKECEMEYKRIIQETVKRRDQLAIGEFDLFIFLALDESTPIEKEVELISTVPEITVIYGSLEAKLKTQKCAPSLLEFYTDHVVTTLSRETEIARSRSD